LDSVRVCRVRPVGLAEYKRKGGAEEMKKLMLLAAMLAMVLTAALPAIAQVGGETEQEGESADLDQTFTVTSEGDNSSQCANIQGVGNTGNTQNVIDLIQYGSTADDFEIEEVGSDIALSPSNPVTCDQQVNQAASASG
jgi:hypothetical protein